MTRRPPDRARRKVLRTLLLPAGLSVGLSAGLLGGCTLNDAQRRDFHLLRDGDAGAVPAKLPPPVDQVLMLDIAAAPTLYDSDHMVFSADGSSRSYFQFAQWSERPSRTLMRLAETRLIAARHFRTVALSSSGVRGDLLLTLRLDELYLDDSRRPGAVHLELPEDVAAEEVEATLFAVADVRRPSPDPKAIRKAADMLRAAKSPLLLIGAGGNRHRTGQALREFVDKSGIYVFCTQMGLGVVDANHPHFMGTG